MPNIPVSHSEMATSAPAAAAPTLIPVPNEKALMHAAKLAIDLDKPVLFDYYLPTCNGEAFLGQDKETSEKMLVKSAQEYTSAVLRLLKAKEDLIVETENSLYIVSGNLKKKEISSTSF